MEVDHLHPLGQNAEGGQRISLGPAIFPPHHLDRGRFQPLLLRGGGEIAHPEQDGGGLRDGHVLASLSPELLVAVAGEYRQ